MKSTKSNPSHIASKHSKTIINSDKSKERLTPVKVPSINISKVKANKNDHNLGRSSSPLVKNDNYVNGNSDNKNNSNNKSLSRNDQNDNMNNLSPYVIRKQLEDSPDQLIKYNNKQIHNNKNKDQKFSRLNTKDFEKCDDTTNLN